MKISVSPRAAAFVLTLLWVLFIGFVGPWLISAPSDVAVVLGIAIAGLLAVATYLLATRPISKKENP